MPFGKRPVTSDSAIARLPLTPELRHREALEAYGSKRYAAALADACALIDEGFGHANALAGAILEEGGHGVSQDFAKALFYYQRATELVGSLEGWLGLGRIYYFGKGLEPDYLKALSIYSIVAEDSDNAIAHLMLGRMLAKGQGISRNVEQARTHLLAASARGNILAMDTLADLEREAGHLLKSAWLRRKAKLKAILIGIWDPADPRLRTC